MNNIITISGPKVAKSASGNKIVTHNIMCDGKCIGAISINDGRVAVIIGTAHHTEALTSFQVRQIFDMMLEFEKANEEVEKIVKILQG